MTIISEICVRAKTVGIGEIETWLRDNKLDSEGAQELASYMANAPYAEMIGCWKAAQANIENLKIIHPHVSDMLVRRTMSGEAG